MHTTTQTDECTLTDICIHIHTHMYIYIHIATVFTWLNVAATIRHVLKFDAATIQGQHILHLSTSMWLLLYFTQVEVNHACWCVEQVTFNS